jgi:Ras-related protein Rab-14
VEFGSFAGTIDGKIVKFQIWDTAGQESFKSVTRIFYRGAHCVFLTYDITRDETFVNAIDWLKEIQEHASPDTLVYLIGNKAELEDEREITFDRAIEFARAHKISKVFETSAKTGNNVEDVFGTAIKEVYRTTIKSQEEESVGAGSGLVNPATGK